MKNKILTKIHKRNWAGQHLELLYWAINGQLKIKIDLPPKKVSTRDTLTKVAETVLFSLKLKKKKLEKK